MAVKIFEADLSIVKSGNTIMMNFDYTAWRYNRPENVENKFINFKSGSKSLTYTIRSADIQPTSLTLLFTSTPNNLVGGQTYHVEIYEGDPPSDEVVEWKSMSRTENISVTIRYESDPNLAQGQTRRVEGTPGVRTYTWEEKYVNGVSTGEKRNETSSTTKSMTQTVVYNGTKANTPVANAQYYKIGELQKNQDGIFKGTFDLRALSNIKFTASGLSITNVALYDGEGTDIWTRALEDIDNKISNGLIELSGTIKNNIEGLEQSLRQDLASKNEVVAINTYEDFIKKYDLSQESLNTNLQSAKQDIIDALSRTAAIETNLGEGAADWIAKNTTIRMSEEGITIGNKADGTYVLVSSEKIAFFSGSTDEVAYVSSGMLYINQAVFVTSIQISDFIVSSEKQGHLTFRYAPR